MRSLSLSILFASAANAALISIPKAPEVPPSSAGGSLESAGSVGSELSGGLSSGSESSGGLRSGSESGSNVGSELSGGLSSGSGLAGADAGAAASRSTSPFPAGEASAENNELLKAALERAEDVFDILNNIVDLATGGGDDDDDDDDDDDSVFSPATTAQLPRNHMQSATNGTAKYAIAWGNTTYDFNPRLLSKDIVADMAGGDPNRLESQRDLFTSEEYSMFLDDPICFYANIERMYLDAASTSSPGVSNPTTSPTSSPTSSQRPTIPYGDPAQYNCAELNVQGCYSPSDDSSPSRTSAISSLWATQLPDQLWSAHFAVATPTNGGTVTATATSTTTCSGLDGRDGPVTKYRELKVRGGETASTSSGGGGDATSTARMVTGEAGRCVEGRWLRSGAWMGVVLAVLSATAS